MRKPLLFALCLLALFLCGRLTVADAARRNCGAEHNNCLVSCNNLPRGPAGSAAANHFLACLKGCDYSYNGCMRVPRAIP